MRRCFPCGVLALFILGHPALAAKLKTLYSFEELTGSRGSFAVAANGVMYGTASEGGTAGDGFVFSFDPKTSVYSVIYNFQGGNDGKEPAPGLVFGPDNDLYGVTESGGQSGVGTVFRIDPSSGAETVLFSFHGSAGTYPVFGPVFGTDGNLYGTTPSGGGSGDGALYQLNPTSGAEQTMLAFNGTNGKSPNMLTVGNTGVLYGDTEYGGSNGYGLVYDFDPSTGTQTILAELAGGVDEELNPVSNVVPGPGGNLYLCIGASVFSLDPQSGEIDDLFLIDSFGGSQCAGGILLDANQNIFGTYVSGSNNSGIFRYNIATQVEKRLAHFHSEKKQGGLPGGVAFGPRETLYGATYSGTPTGDGSIFEVK